MRMFTFGRMHILTTLAVVFAAGVVSHPAFAQKEYAIAAVQGVGDRSPLVNEAVSVTGVVTARIRTGFFLQTPDDRADTDPATSEGIFVFTKSEPSVAVGDLVTVTGSVEEYRPRNEPISLPVTEISHRISEDTLKVISKANALPKPFELTPAGFKANTIGQLERFEGMRVHAAALMVVAPTGGRVDIKNSSADPDGVFFAVVKGLPRPFREPGLDIREITDREKLNKELPRLQIFDGNPELIRVDSDEQKSDANLQSVSSEGKIGAGGTMSVSPLSLDVAAGTGLSDMTGVLHYAGGRYTLLPDLEKSRTTPDSIKPKALPAPTDRQFSIAGMNLENFFDDVDDPAIKEDVVTPTAFAHRLKKISSAIRDYMRTPDVIGTIEVENLAALKKLAERVNADAVASGEPNPKYEAFLVDGNDGRGIDNGFLVKTSRVKVIEVKQLGKDEKYKNPDTGDDNFLNDRPPLMLRASIDDAKTGKPFEFTVIVNHLKSFLGYNDPKQMANVRLKKRLQAEFLAKSIQERQKQNPGERIAVIGDFNAYQFNDGVLDVIGTITGKTAGKDEVFNPSDDLVDPNLTDLVDVINEKERYSYSFDGSGQVLDHILISDGFKNHVNGFGYARVNADFPEAFRNDQYRVERFSDHDPAIAFFTFDDVTKPTQK
ncbi:MAG: hypothetical protein ABI791_12390 [Acidobacteriota bacterium]